LKNKIDQWGGEENFLGSKAYDLIYGDKYKRTHEAADLGRITGEMSKTLEGTEKALDIMDEKINLYTKDLESQWFVSDEEKNKLELMKKQRAALERKRRNQSQEQRIKIEGKNETHIDSILISEAEEEINRSKAMTDKVNVISTKVMGDQIISAEDMIKPSAVNMESSTGSGGVTPEEITYLPKVMHDTTNMIIENSKEEGKRSREAQKQQAPVIIPPPSAPAPVDLNKSIDDPTLTLFNNDIFG
jgi:hypothetical protein